MKMVKTVVVLIFAFIPLIFGDETDKDKVFSECLTELSINEDVVDHFKENEGELPENADQKVKCFFHCIGKKFGAGDEAGNINTEKVIEFVSTHYPVSDKEKLTSVIKSCAERSETDVCDKWYEFSKCQFKEVMALRAEKE